MRTSDHLNPGQTYTRDQLRQMFAITDATINTGVFRPAGHDSVWLFVTRDKQADRVQFHDELIGDELHWEGQTTGRTDELIIRHIARGLALLLFYRISKHEHPGAGFTYEGPFSYVRHRGAHPTSFILRRLPDTPPATQLASPRQRAWFRLPDSVDRARAFEIAASTLLTAKPEGTAILSFNMYPPGEGASPDPRTVTLMWELQYLLDETRDWDWGHTANEKLAGEVQARVTTHDPSDDPEPPTSTTPRQAGR